MSRAIVSGVAGGDWERLADKTWPVMEKYAAACNAQFLGSQIEAFGRPASWGKLPLIARALSAYADVLWIDADVSTATANKDIFAECPPAAHAGLCWLTSGDGCGHFNCGVWLVRRAFNSALVSVAMMDDCVHHPWWEQAGVNRLIRQTSLCVHTLSEEWNCWAGSPAHIVPQFRHACGITPAQRKLEWLGLA